jgi:hypothetical protein
MENGKKPEEGEWKMGNGKLGKTGIGVMENGKKPDEGQWKKEMWKRRNGKWGI